MSGSGAPQSGVTLRQDLMALTEEIQFTDLNLAADRILPPVSMDARTGNWPVLPREARMKVPDTARHADGSYTRGQWNFSSDTFYCYEYGFEETVDLVDQLVWEKFINMEEISSQLAWQGLLLARESRAAAALFNTTTFTGATNTGAITNEWDDATNATPWADIEAAAIILRGKCGFNKMAMTLLLTEDNCRFGLNTSEVKNSVIYTEAVPTMASARKVQFFAEYLGIKDIELVSAMYDTTGLNQDMTVGQFWSNEYGMLCVKSPNTNSPKRLGVGSQPVFTKYAQNYIVETYMEPQKNREVIRAREYRGTKINTDYGYLISNMKTTVVNGF